MDLFRHGVRAPHVADARLEDSHRHRSDAGGTGTCAAGVDGIEPSLGARDSSRPIDTHRDLEFRAPHGPADLRCSYSRLSKSGTSGTYKSVTISRRRLSVGGTGFCSTRVNAPSPEVDTNDHARQ